MSEQQVSIAGGKVNVVQPTDVKPVEVKPVAEVEVTPQPVNTPPEPVVDHELEKSNGVPEDTPTPIEPSLYRPEDGDTEEDIIIGMLHESTGVTEDHVTSAIVNALKYGDASLINYSQIYSDAGVTDPSKQAQVKTVVDNLYKKAYAQHQLVTKTVYDMAGGKANYETALQAFQENASPALQLQVTSLANAGYLQESVQLLLYTVRDTGLVSHKSSPLLEVAASQQAQPKTVDVQQGVRELIAKYGSNFLSNKEARRAYEQLTKHN